ncbi:hypothetical protein RJ639_038397 [Escallonia herrerae]|uniref:Transposase-associated domain-containing protein n=1 Tax=Escallonia herrerae TaxID=1293975 RepID=A0AA88WPL2_9ASTE|nr:hypothetical protein RJ639_038397 [Escallonia herrerae]
MKKYVAPKEGRKEVTPVSEERKEREENMGMINTIAGDIAAGGSFEQARKAYAREMLKVSMDKSWINIRNRLDPLYEKGADDFVKFASKDRPNATEILCPCTKCRNMKFVKKVDVAEHIVVDGFLSSYTHWIFHGKSSLTSSSIPEPAVGDRTQEMIRDAFGVPMFNQLDEIGSGEGNEDSDGLDDVQMLYEEGDEALSEEAISLAMGPLKKAERYTGYVINGFKYHTKARESNRATQHSGVMVKANTDSYASARDMNPIAGDKQKVVGGSVGEETYEYLFCLRIKTSEEKYKGRASRRKLNTCIN